MPPPPLSLPATPFHARASVLGHACVGAGLDVPCAVLVRHRPTPCLVRAPKPRPRLHVPVTRVTRYTTCYTGALRQPFNDQAGFAARAHQHQCKGTVLLGDRFPRLHSNVTTPQPLPRNEWLHGYAQCRGQRVGRRLASKLVTVQASLWLTACCVSSQLGTSSHKAVRTATAAAIVWPRPRRGKGYRTAGTPKPHLDMNGSNIKPSKVHAATRCPSNPLS